MKHGKGRSKMFRQDLAKIRSQEFRREALAKIGSHWPLWLVLIVQTVLTVRNIAMNGIALKEGDGAAVSDEKALSFAGTGDVGGEFLIFDLA